MSLIGTITVFVGGEVEQPEIIVPRTAAGGLPVGRTYVCIGGERLDQVAQTAYGIQAGAVEALLVANPGLADQPYYLPKNLAIELPELITSKRNRSREVPLWQ